MLRRATTRGTLRLQRSLGTDNKQERTQQRPKRIVQTKASTHSLVSTSRDPLHGRCHSCKPSGLHDMIRTWHLALQIVTLLVPLGRTQETSALPTPGFRDDQCGQSSQHRRNAQLAPPHIDMGEGGLPGSGTGGPMRIGIELKSALHAESQGEGPELQGPGQQHDGNPGSLAPIVPYFNNTSISSIASTSEYTTSTTLPNGGSVHVEHHVSIDIDIEVSGAGGSLPGSPEMPGDRIAIPNPLPTQPPPRPAGGKTCRRKSVTLTETKTVVKQVVTTITSAVTTTVTEPGAAPPSVTTSSQTQSIPTEPAKPPTVSNPLPTQAPSPTHAPASSSSATSSSSSTSSSVSKQPNPPAKPPSAPAGFQSGVVGAHNEWREKYGAKALTYDAGLAAKAQKWADKCIWEHPLVTTFQSGSCQIADRTSRRERLASNLDSAASSDGNAKLSPEDILQHWINGPNEASSWNPSSPVGSHFTQAVWKGATKVGCAILSCDLSIYDASWWPAKFAVCIYDTGNVIGQFDSNVGSLAS